MEILPYPNALSYTTLYVKCQIPCQTFFRNAFRGNFTFFVVMHGYFDVVAVVHAACSLPTGAVVYTNDQALEESEKKLPIVIDEDSKSKMVETAALW